MNINGSELPRSIPGRPYYNEGATDSGADYKPAYPPKGYIPKNTPKGRNGCPDCITDPGSRALEVSARRFRVSHSAGARAVPKAMGIDFGNAPLGIKTRPMDADVKRATRKVWNAIAQIKIKGKDGRGGSGSGFVVDRAQIRKWFPGISVGPNDYFVHTNYHVAGNVKEITVLLKDGKQTFPAEIVKAPNGAELKYDDGGDTTLLRIRSSSKLATAKFGSRSMVEIGDTVIALGHPLGLPRRVATTGRVSQTHALTGQLLEALQHEAAINPGNSGGPVINLDGIVVGTNTYTYRGAQNMSFAIAIDDQFKILREIWQRGEVVRGDLGITFSPLDGDPKLPKGLKGAVVADVRRGSRAEKRGLKRGDIVTEIRVLDNGIVMKRIPIDMRSNFELTRILKKLRTLNPGWQVELKLYRKKMDMGRVSYVPGSINLNVIKRTKIKKAVAGNWGFSAELSMDGKLVVTSVADDKAAAGAGIKAGHVLVGFKAREIAGFKPQKFRGIRDLEDMLSALDQKGSHTLILYVKDPKDPKRIRPVVLERDIDENLFGSRVA